MKKILLLALFAICMVLACDDQRPQSDIDNDKIVDYLKAKNIKAEKHASGIYYTLQTPGTGNSPNAGSRVTVKYKGYLLDGTVFDQTKENETFTISLQQQVIPGWQIVVPLLKPGGRGTFYLPSGWAYGRSGTNDGVIKPNEITIFDIELISFR